MNMECVEQARYIKDINERAYANNQEYLEDELARLDIRIQLAFLRSQTRNTIIPATLRHDRFSFHENTDSAENAEKLSAVAALATASNEVDESSLHATLVKLNEKIEQRRFFSAGDGVSIGLFQLANLFRLNSLEEQLVIACLALELDLTYGEYFAALQGDPASKLPTVNLLLELFSEDEGNRRKVRNALSPHAPLFVYRLLHLVEEPTYKSPSGLANFIRIDARIAKYLLGSTNIDESLTCFADVQFPTLHTMWPNGAEDCKDRVSNFIRQHLESSKTPQALAFFFHGSDTSTPRTTVNGVCHDLSLPILNVDMEKMPASIDTQSALFWLIGRETVLQPSVLCLDNFHLWVHAHERNCAQQQALFNAIRHFSQVSFLLSTGEWNPGNMRRGLVYIDIDFPMPDISVRKAQWETLLSVRDISGVDTGILASKFRFNGEQIQQVLDEAETIAYWRDSSSRIVTSDDILEACRQQVSPQLGPFATKMDPKYQWRDLIIPPDHKRHLREICDQAKHRDIVYGSWGFGRRLSLGNGLNVMFNGPPGTGKTMAAEVIANELQVDTYKIDLSQIVSKYIGETEKNLDRIFHEAEKGNAIIFFDEADALFGKRSEVKDAHDRYANLETGYLLQKMEEQTGIVILASNLRHNLDDAFLRRMHFVVEFPFPDEIHRNLLWRGLMSEEVPREQDVDFDFLSKNFKIPGGNIKNIVVCAAFLAAAEGSGIGMRHLIRATKREYQKLGWPCTSNDFGPYYELVKV